MEWSKLLLWVRKKQFDDGHIDSLSPEDQRLAADMEKIWQSVETYRSDYEPDAEAGLARFKARIREDDARADIRQLPIRKRRAGRRLAIAAAVAVTVAVGVAVLFYGGNSKSVLLAETLKGEVRKVTLPDGSVVMMNENSRLEMDWQTTNRERPVSFSGEGFFRIVPDPDKPFVITTARSKTTVVGTSFNLRDQEHEAFAEIEVVTGKVQFEGERDQEAVSEKERAVIDEEGSLRVGKAQNLNADSWVDQKLVFRKTPLRTVIADLERHFGVRIDFENEALLDCFWNTSYKDETLENILKAIEVGREVKFTQKESGYYVASGGHPCPS